MESKQSPRKFLAWPFWLADGLLLCWAAIIWIQNKDTPSLSATSFYILAVGLAFACGVAPILLEKWYVERERRRLLNQEFQEKVALALGEVLDRLDRMERPLAAAPAQWQEGLLPKFTEIENRLTALGKSIDAATSQPKSDGEATRYVQQLSTLVEQQQQAHNQAQQVLVAKFEELAGLLTKQETELARVLEEIKEDKKKQSRRGVTGILYPEHTSASWIARGNKPGREELKQEQVDTLPTDVEVAQAEETTELEEDAVTDSAADAVAETIETAEVVEPVAAKTEALDVQVMALIGIGNKPFLRGNIPGLNMEQGTPMEFVEIGKWQWKGEYAADQGGKIEVWLNDDKPARENPVLVDRPHIEIRPVFS